MSVYLEEGRGWKYSFVLNGIRHQGNYYKTKRRAQKAEAARREELENPPLAVGSPETPTDMAFLELVNRRLDFLQAYRSESHYRETKYMAKRWAKLWGDLNCAEMSTDLLEMHVLRRGKRGKTPYTANKEIRYLRSLFNFGIKRKYITVNPAHDLEFLPVEKKAKYIPPVEDVVKVISLAEPDTQDYLWTIRDTMGRMSEINRLTWDDVDFKAHTITLYTRKKRGGHLTPRRVPMTSRLLNIMQQRYKIRDNSKPWVFWHKYWSRKAADWVEGPYTERKRLMKSLCKKAGVPYFRYHALRHAGASLLDNKGVPIGAIQRILGHENRSTTEVYLHSLGLAEREAITHLENVSGEKSLSKSLSDQKKRLRLVT